MAGCAGAADFDACTAANDCGANQAGVPPFNKLIDCLDGTCGDA